MSKSIGWKKVQIVGQITLFSCAGVGGASLGNASNVDLLDQLISIWGMQSIGINQKVLRSDDMSRILMRTQVIAFVAKLNLCWQLNHTFDASISYSSLHRSYWHNSLIRSTQLGNPLLRLVLGTSAMEVTPKSTRTDIIFIISLETPSVGNESEENVESSKGRNN